MLCGLGRGRGLGGRGRWARARRRRGRGRWARRGLRRGLRRLRARRRVPQEVPDLGPVVEGGWARRRRRGRLGLGAGLCWRGRRSRRGGGGRRSLKERQVRGSIDTMMTERRPELDDKGQDNGQHAEQPERSDLGLEADPHHRAPDEADEKSQQCDVHVPTLRSIRSRVRESRREVRRGRTSSSRGPRITRSVTSDEARREPHERSTARCNSATL